MHRVCALHELAEKKYCCQFIIIIIIIFILNAEQNNSEIVYGKPSEYYIELLTTNQPQQTLYSM